MASKDRTWSFLERVSPPRGHETQSQWLPRTQQSHSNYSRGSSTLPPNVTRHSFRSSWGCGRPKSPSDRQDRCRPEASNSRNRLEGCPRRAFDEPLGAPHAPGPRYPISNRTNSQIRKYAANSLAEHFALVRCGAHGGRHFPRFSLEFLDALPPSPHTPGSI